MESIYTKAGSRNITSRIDQLNIESQRLWGTMDVAAMMAHCSAYMEVATGKVNHKRNLPGILLGRFFRSLATSDRPYKQGELTDPHFVVKEERDFTTEKERLTALVEHFISGGMAEAAKSKHPFFGSLSKEEWGRAVYKHLDHHLRQFGV